MSRLIKELKDAAQEKIDGAQIWEKIGDLQIVGHSHVAPLGKSAINTYTLEDGSQVIEDDANKAIAPKAADYIPVKRVKPAKAEA